MCLPHRHWPKELLRLISIVRTAAQLKIVDHRLPARCKRNHVMDFKKASLATAAVVTNERALPAVACPDRALDYGGHMTRAWASVA